MGDLISIEAWRRAERRRQQRQRQPRPEQLPRRRTLAEIMDGPTQDGGPYAA